MGAIIKYLRPLAARISIGLMIKSAGTVMDLFLPYILAYLIDDAVPTKNLKLIIFLGILMLMIAIVGWLGNIIANRMAAAVAQKTTQSIRHDLYVKTINLSNRDIDANSIPALQNRLTSDTYNIHQIVGMMQRLGVRAPILLIGGVVMTLAMDPPLALVMLGMMPIIGFLIYKISRKGIPLYTKTQEAVDGMVRVSRENIQGIRIIKSLSKEEYEKSRFQKENLNVAERESAASSMMAVTNPLMSFLLNTGFVLVILAGAYRVKAEKIEVGTIIAFQTYFIIILNAMLSVNRIFMMYSKGSASAKRIKEILDIDDERSIIPQPQKAFNGEEYLVFEKVNFSYNGSKNNINDISFSLKKGGTLGIIGGTGSGKTTLIALMLGYYRDYTGFIYIDGEEIRSIPLEVLRRKFGTVLQNDFIFTDTIGGNITLDRDITDESVEKAIEIAQAKDFIDNLDERFAYNLNARGTNLSGGQRQRVLISRAMAGNPDILVLDDSCSALDYKTDALLRNAIKTDISEETTKIIIAQRISSVMNSDLIIVLDDGKITEMGDHEHLMKASSIYQQIAGSQMGGIIQ